MKDKKEEKIERVTVNYIDGLCDEKYWKLVEGDDVNPKPHFVLENVPLKDLRDILLDKNLKYTPEVFAYIEGDVSHIKQFCITKHYIFVNQYSQEDLEEDASDFFNEITKEDVIITDLICDIIKEEKPKRFDSLRARIREICKNNDTYYWPHVQNQLTMYWLRCNRNHKLACSPNSINGLA